MQKHILPAVIADNQEELNKMIKSIDEFAKIIHLDFMDGKFVPNPSLDFDFTLPESKSEFEAHLMVADPKMWIKNHGKKVDTILVHIETTDNPQEIIDSVKKINKRIGFVLNPESSLESIKPILDQLDQVLIMTVNPGFYGSPFLPEMSKKISELRSLKPDLDIEADGSVNDETVVTLKEAGVNMFCSGSYVMKADNPADSMNTLKNKVTD